MQWYIHHNFLTIINFFYQLSWVEIASVLLAIWAKDGEEPF